MIFQTFDEKKDCFMVYKRSEFHRSITPTCTQTWSYAPYLRDVEVEYASLYILEKSLEELCPSGRRSEFAEVQSKIKAVIKSCNETGLDLNTICIYEVMPRHLLATWATIKTEICQNVFNNYKKPKNYEQLLKITKVIADIKYRRLNIEPHVT